MNALLRFLDFVSLWSGDLLKTFSTGGDRIWLGFRRRPLEAQGWGRIGGVQAWGEHVPEGQGHRDRREGICLEGSSGQELGQSQAIVLIGCGGELASQKGECLRQWVRGKQLLVSNVFIWTLVPLPNYWACYLGRE